MPLAIKSYLTAYPVIFLYLWFGINWLNWGSPSPGERDFSMKPCDKRGYSPSTCPSHL